MDANVKTMSVVEFCRRFKACEDGRYWAYNNCKSMAHAWDTARGDRLVWIATRLEVISEEQVYQLIIAALESLEVQIGSGVGNTLSTVAGKYVMNILKDHSTLQSIADNNDGDLEALHEEMHILNEQTAGYGATLLGKAISIIAGDIPECYKDLPQWRLCNLRYELFEYLIGHATGQVIYSISDKPKKAWGKVASLFRNACGNPFIGVQQEGNHNGQ